MVLRTTALVTLIMIGLAAPQGEALAQFIPPGPPVAAPPPFQTLPPVADEELPPYDPPPGYRSSGPYGAPQTYEQCRALLPADPVASLHLAHCAALARGDQPSLAVALAQK